MPLDEVVQRRGVGLGEGGGDEHRRLPAPAGGGWVREAGALPARRLRRVEQPLQHVQIDRLDEVVVEPGLAASGAGPRRGPSRSSRPAGCPRTPTVPAAAGRPRSRSCPAGRCRARRPRVGGSPPPASASEPSWATPTSWPISVEQQGEAVGRVAVVVDDEDAPAAAAGPGRPLGRSVGGPVRRPSIGAGRRTTNSLPRPGPSLRAATVPPCISTRLRTRLRPIPRPPCERSSRRSAWVNRSKMCGSISAAMPDARRPGRRTTASSPSRLDRQDDPAAGVGVLGGVGQQVVERPAPAGSGRPRAGRLGRGSRDRQAGGRAASMSGPARLDGAGRRPTPGPPAPSGARPCPR